MRSHLHMLFMISIWNARGAASKEFGNAVKELRRRYKPSILVLLETRCSGVGAQKAIKRMGFRNQILSEAQGMTGGIWILWNDASVSIKVVQCHKQFIHCRIEGLGNTSWWFTAVYASPREMERRELWQELHKISINIQGAWLVAGDFNDIMTSDEQRGGVVPLEQKCRRFCHNIDKCHLMDLGSEGHRYTWRGPILSHATRIYKRLDRALSNNTWRLQFGEAKVLVGPRLNSDHHPLMIKLEGNQHNPARRPFRFEAAWLMHSNFKNLVKEKWQHETTAWKALRALEGELSQWNSNCFGHIKHRKRELLNRISGIQRSLQEYDNPFLEELEG